jgi:acyl-CoA thioester hydrolase
MKFSHSFRVSAEDIDAQGHVNNVVYVRWIQDVAIAHWEHAATAEQQEKFTWIIVRHEIDYKKQAFEAEKITAATWVDNWRGFSCERFTEITRGADLLVKSKAVWCMIDKKTHRPTRIGEDLKNLFRELTEI